MNKPTFNKLFNKLYNLLTFRTPIAMFSNIIRTNIYTSYTQVT